MKKILSIFSVLSLVFLFSCEKNEITYGTTDLDVNKFAQIKFVYDLPQPSSSAQNITRLMYNDQIYSEIGTPLGSVLPNSIAKFHVLPIGSNKVDAFKGSAKDQLVYTSNFNVEKGVWHAFIYNENQPPLMVKEPDTYQTGHPWADTVAYIKFVNLFHKSDGVTPYGRLTLKGVRVIDGVTTYIDIATCDFMEASDYIPYKLDRKGIAVWSGTETSMIFTLFDAAGNQLTHYATSSATTKSNFVASGYSLTKGVNYIFHFNGKEGVSSSSTQVLRLSTVAVQ
jgi:hypothetical protein